MARRDNHLSPWEIASYQSINDLTTGIVRTVVEEVFRDSHPPFGYAINPWVTLSNQATEAINIEEEIRGRLEEALVRAAETRARTGNINTSSPWEPLFPSPVPVKAQTFDEWLKKSAQVIEETKRRRE